MSEDWRTSIVQLVQIKQAIFEADKEKLWEYRLPRSGASEEALAEVEESLGFALDQEYRSFLNFGDGWPAFYQTVTLFGTTELRGSTLLTAATKILDAADPELFVRCGIPRCNLFPIAATVADLDVFVMQVHGRRLQPTVIWLAGDEIDRYASFGEYFASIVEYNRRELAALAAGNSR